MLSFLWQDILKQANDDGLTTAKELPYFDGDFWPNALEDSIKELDQEEEERKTAAAAAAADTAGKEVLTGCQHAGSFAMTQVRWIVLKVVPH